MEKYTKRNGELPCTPFKQGDIVVYESRHGQTNIILLNRIREEAHGDIFFNTMLTFAIGELPYIEHHTGKEDWRNWFNGDTLRLATRSEISIFMEAALQLPNAKRNSSGTLLFKDLPELSGMMGYRKKNLRPHRAEEWEFMQ